MPESASEWMTAEEVAELLRVSSRTLHRWRERGIGPAWVQVERVVRYRRSTVLRWLDEEEARHAGGPLPEPSD